MRREAFAAVLTALAVGCGGGGSGGGVTLLNASFEVTAAEATPGRVEIRFDRAVDPDEARDASHFQVRGLPVLGSSLSTDGRTVVLDTAHQVGRPYELSVAGLHAADGQPLATAMPLVVDGAGPAPLQTITSPTDMASLFSAGWQVVDDPGATSGGPSIWFVQGGAIKQISNIFGGSSATFPFDDHPGTYLVWAGQALTDTVVEATLRNGDDDGMGLLVRYRDPSNFYRFEWDQQRSCRRIVRVVGGVSETIAMDSARFERGLPARVRFEVEGDRLAVFCDDALVLRTRDGSITDGFAGVYCWGSDELSVGDLSIAGLGGPLPLPLAEPDAARPRPDGPLAISDVASAEVTHEAALLWLEASDDASVVFEVSDDPSFQGAVHVSAPPAPTTTPRTVAVEVQGLSAATSYVYRARLTDPLTGVENVSRTGRFTTAPPPFASADVRFAFATNLAPDVGELMPLLGGIHAKDPDFFVGLGNLVYGGLSPAATTLAEYRFKARWVRGFPSLRQLLLDVPHLAVWNDFEVANDWDQTTDPTLAARGTQAFQEYFPWRPVPAAQGGQQRSARWGADLEVFLLDVRRFRSANTAPDDPQKTMLGSAQLQWLLAALSASTATFKVVISAVPLRFGTLAGGLDSWEGFQTERTALFDHIVQNGITGVCFLTGDQRWMAVHHHPEGPVEVQVGPLTHPPRTPPSPADPAVVFSQGTRGYGIARLDAGASTLSIDLYDQNDVLIHTEVITP